MKTRKSTPSGVVVPTVPKGQAKSGRFWKGQKERASTMVKTNKAWINPRREKREADSRDVKELAKSLRDSRSSELEAKRLREAENKRRKEENSKKSEVVQVIRNSAKLKRMKKKQLRKIEKRDTTVVVKDKDTTAA